jgi:hypothetical protein
MIFDKPQSRPFRQKRKAAFAISGCRSSAALDCHGLAARFGRGEGDGRSIASSCNGFTLEMAHEGKTMRNKKRVLRWNSYPPLDILVVLAEDLNPEVEQAALQRFCVENEE